MSNIKEQTLCQMSMTKPHTDLGILQGLYINVTNSCNSDYRYTFNKLVQKLTKYTSYKVVKVVVVGQIS